MGPAIVNEYVSEHCGHCRARFGHFIWCAVINRNTAEAWSAVSELLSDSDKIHAKALGVTFGSLVHDTAEMPLRRHHGIP